MNIINVFKNTVTSLLGENNQSVNESLIELATFFYKIDGRVSLEEQQYIDELMNTIDWQSSVSVEAFQSDCIAKINSMLDFSEAEVLAYLSGVMETLAKLGAADKAKSLAQNIADADGEIADAEVKYLEFIMAFD